jgi:integrase
MQGGVKSRNGKGRVVPIHSKVFELVKRRYDEGGDYVFQNDGKRCSNSRYYEFWNTIMQAHDMEHTPHECRHTFRSRLDSAGANRSVVNKIMGHMGERVYTHKTIQELKDTIELITR